MEAAVAGVDPRRAVASFFSPSSRRRGTTLVEIVIVLAVAGILAAVALPALMRTSASLRLEMAAAELASTLRLTRAYALRRGVNVAIRFRWTDDGEVSFTMYRDGDGDGVRNRDIEDGIDPQEQPTRRLTRLGRRIGFGFPPGSSPRDPTSGRLIDRLDDPIRFNRSDLASFGAGGTATPGTLYLTDGVRGLIAVRVTNRTGRVRTLRYDAESGSWRLV